jgi:phosphatidylglycerophosphate synthase
MNDIILTSFFTAAILVIAVLWFSYFPLAIKAMGNKKYTGIQLFFRDRKYLYPNEISNWRLVAGPICAIFLYISLEYQLILLQASLINIIAFLAATDALDGQVARCCGLESAEGEIIDPKADKFFDLPILAVLSIFISPYFLIFVTTLTICDIIGQNKRSNIKHKAANIIGKIKTSIKFTSIFIFYLFISIDLLHLDIVFYSLMLLSIISVIFTFWSMILKFDFVN